MCTHVSSCRCPYVCVVDVSNSAALPSCTRLHEQACSTCAPPSSLEPRGRPRPLQGPCRARPTHARSQAPGAARLPALGPAGRQVRARARGQLLRVRPQLAGRQQAAQTAQQRRMAREECARRQLEHAPGEPLHRRPGGPQDARFCLDNVGTSLEHTGPQQRPSGLPASHGLLHIERSCCSRLMKFPRAEHFREDKKAARALARTGCSVEDAVAGGAWAPGGGEQ
jgi:hypothetical protein